MLHTVNWQRNRCSVLMTDADIILFVEYQGTDATDTSCHQSPGYYKYR
jgi:hypothetical protein